MVVRKGTGPIETTSSGNPTGGDGHHRVTGQNRVEDHPLPQTGRTTVTKEERKPRKRTLRTMGKRNSLSDEHKFRESWYTVDTPDRVQKIGKIRGQRSRYIFLNIIMQTTSHYSSVTFQSSKNIFVLLHYVHFVNFVVGRSS